MRDQFSPFQYRAFSLSWIARFAAVLGVQIQSVVVAWQVYDITRNPADLGLIGLILFLPAFFLIALTGTVADRYSRRLIVVICLAVEAICSVGLIVFSLLEPKVIWPVFLILAVFGTARAFFGPAFQALIPNLVPPHERQQAIALGVVNWQAGSIIGPIIGGLIYDIAGPAVSYSVACGLFIFGSFLVSLLAKPKGKREKRAVTIQEIVAGFHYMWKEKSVLGAISLDLFAVLLGGVVALLPVYAREILHVEGTELGLLRGAPGVGAVIVTVYLAFRPIRDHAGVIMFVFVAIFGLANVIFGLSTSLWLSIFALAVAGGADMISVYIREILIQIWTPDALRGRVNAINSVFIGASNELGETRAGFMAAAIGAVPTVVFGGLATIGVALSWMYLFPQLRKTRQLDKAPFAQD